MGKSFNKKCFAVQIGRAPGVYKTWPECEKQTKGFPGALFKGFQTEKEAQAFVDARQEDRSAHNRPMQPQDSCTSSNAGERQADENSDLANQAAWAKYNADKAAYDTQQEVIKKQWEVPCPPFSLSCFLFRLHYSIDSQPSLFLKRNFLKDYHKAQAAFKQQQQQPQQQQQTQQNNPYAAQWAAYNAQQAMQRAPPTTTHQHDSNNNNESFDDEFGDIDNSMLSEIDDVLSQQASQQKPPRRHGECFYFPEGKCFKGAKCPYKHLNPDGIPATIVQSPKQSPKLVPKGTNVRATFRISRRDRAGGGNTTASLPSSAEGVLRGKQNVSLYIQGGEVWFQFNYVKPAIDAIKECIKGRRYDQAKKQWAAPLEALPDCVKLFEHMGRKVVTRFT